MVARGERDHAGAALLGGASVALARSLRLGSAATAAATAAILFGGYLCLYTGESKAFAEACVVVVAFSACAFAAIDIDDDRAKTSGRRASGVGALLGAGSITAAFFLKEFVGDTPWVHLDIAGVDFYEKEKGVIVKGASGIPVRTLVHLALELADKPIS